MRAPDLDAFQAAQEHLMDVAGAEITLLIPLPTLWPPGTQLDPESGKPRDPWVRPLSSGFASAACSGVVSYAIAYRRFESLPDAEAQHIRQRGAVIIRDSDYRAGGSAATRAYVNGEYIDLVKWVPDGPGRVMRWLSMMQERQ